MITCCYCSKIYENPKFLPCGNSICLKCAIEQNLEIDCKFCSNKHSIESVNDLVTNQFLVKLIEYINETAANEPSQSLYDNLNTASGIGNSKFLNKEMNDKLLDHLANVKQKVETINNGYALARNKIETECNKTCDEINRAAEFLISDIKNKKQIMLNDVDLYKNELLIDYQERFESNKLFEKTKHEINKAYVRVMEEFNSINNENSNVDSPNRLRILFEKIEILNAKINDQNIWLIPDPNPSVGLMFNRNEQPIQIPFIGDISYDSVYKIDMIAKITFFNNTLQQRSINVSSLIIENPISKHIGLISKNKVLVLFEKFFGKVKSTFAKIVYFDGSILHEKEIVNVGNLSTYFIYDNFIIIVFRKSKNDPYVHIYDANLKLLKEQSINFEITSILMNDESIFFISDKKPFINEYDYELNFKFQYGQKTKEKNLST